MKLWKTLTVVALAAATLVLTGCSDSSSNSVVAPQRSLDTAPPAVPTSLTAAAGRSTVKIGWRENTTDLDIEGFLVYRLAFGQTWLLTDAPVLDNRYVDRAPLIGRATYAVTAVDVNGNESAWSQIQYNFQGEDANFNDPTVD